MQQDQDLAVAAAYASGQPVTKQRHVQSAERPQQQHQGTWATAGLVLQSVTTVLSLTTQHIYKVKLAWQPAGFTPYELDTYDGQFQDLPSVDDLEVAAAAAAAAMEAVGMTSSLAESDEEVCSNCSACLSHTLFKMGLTQHALPWHPCKPGR